MTTIAVLGAGKIGEALLAGLLRSGRAPSDLLFSERHPERSAELTARHGVRAASPAEAAREADVLVVAVKPQDIDTVLTEIGDLRVGTLVVSLCAGLPTSLYESRLPAGTPVVRVMPNTPMVVGEAMSAVSGGTHATEEHLALVTELLGAVGRVVRVPENQQDAASCWFSGSGPAYFFFLVEAMIDAGILLGLPRAVASELIVQSAVGAATMLRDSGEHPVTLREAVTSPAGTTISAIRELEVHGVRAALIAAIEAARDRSVELGRAT
jgi:pyrroline-5-carboxylate reductase